MGPWSDVKHLFEIDDGMLPDIYVENLSNEEIVWAYEWVMRQCTIAHSPTLWSKDQKRDIPIKEVLHPAREFVGGRVESFRHCLAALRIDGVEMPELSISVERGGVSFDYRPGADWNEQKVFAMFRFLLALKRNVPNARILQADEGSYSNPNSEFAVAFANFEAMPSNDSLQAQWP
jgi:hypothetical protein